MRCSGVRQASEEIFDDGCSAEKTNPWPQSLAPDGDVSPTGQVSDPLNPASSSEAQRQTVLEGDQGERPSMIWAADSSKPPGLAEEAGVEAGGADLAPRLAASPNAGGDVVDLRTKAASDRQFLVTSGNKDSSTNMSDALLLDVNNRVQAQIPWAGEGAADSEAQLSVSEGAASTASVERVVLSGERKDDGVEANQAIEAESRGDQTQDESKVAPLEPLPRILSRPWMTRIKASNQDPSAAASDVPPKAMDTSKSVPAPELRSSRETGEAEVGTRNSLIEAKRPRKETTCPDFNGGDEARHQGVPHTTPDLASVFREPQIDTSDASWSDGVTGDTSFTATGDGVESGSSLAGDGIGTAQEGSSAVKDTDSTLTVGRLEEEVGQHSTEQVDLRGRCLEESSESVGTNKNISNYVGKATDATEGLSLLAKGASQRIWPTETLDEPKESGGEAHTPVSKGISASSWSDSNGEAVVPTATQAPGHTMTADESMLVKEEEASRMTPREDIARSGQADAAYDPKVSAVRDTSEPGKTSREEQVTEGDVARETRVQNQDETNRSGSPCVGQTDSQLAVGITASAVGTGAAVDDSSKMSHANVVDPFRCVSRGAGDEKTRAPLGMSTVAGRGGIDTAPRGGEIRVNVFTPQGDIDIWPSPNGEESPRITVAEAAALMGSTSGHSVASGSLWGANSASGVMDGDRVGRSYLASFSSRSFRGDPDLGNPFAEDDSSLYDVGTDRRSASLATAMAMATAAINAANARCAASSSFPGADAFLSPSVGIDVGPGAPIGIQRAKSHEIGSEERKPSLVVTGERKQNPARVPVIAAPRPVKQASRGRNESLDGRDASVNPTRTREGSDGSADRRRESAPIGASESGKSALSKSSFDDEHVREGATVVASRRIDSSVETQSRRQDELELSKTGAVVVPEASGVGAAQLGDGIGAGPANSDGGRNRGTSGVGRCCVLS